MPIHRLRGSVLGLVGFGRIPQLVAPKARAFGLRVIAHDPYAAPDVLARAGVEHVESKSIQGNAIIKLQFHPGTDMSQAMSETVQYVSRARAFEDIAASLPPTDPRVAVYRDAATRLAQISIKSMYDASYEGTHWIATYIVDYLMSQRRRPAAGSQP